MSVGETIPCLQRGALRMDIPAAWPDSLAARLATEHNPTGLDSRMFAYLTPSEETIRGQPFQWRHRFFHALGATTLHQSDPLIRNAVADHLRDAAWVTGREEASVGALRDAGVRQARFSWDTAVLQPVLEPAGITALQRVEPPRPGGTLLVQANAAFLRQHGEQLASQIAAVAQRFSSVRIALAGLAAYHDTIESARSLARTLVAMGCSAQVAENLDVSAVVEEIKCASCVVATSLHFRILALTHAVPRVSLANDKAANWARCCDPLFPSDCAADTVAPAVAEAIGVPARHAIECARDARRESLAAMQTMLAGVAECARSPEARCHLPTGGLSPDHMILPRVWVDALGVYLDRAAADLAEATEAKRTARDKARQLREELKVYRESTLTRLARMFRR